MDQDRRHTRTHTHKANDWEGAQWRLTYIFRQRRAMLCPMGPIWIWNYVKKVKWKWFGCDVAGVGTRHIYIRIRPSLSCNYGFLFFYIFILCPVCRKCQTLRTLGIAHAANLLLLVVRCANYFEYTQNIDNNVYGARCVHAFAKIHEMGFYTRTRAFAQSIEAKWGERKEEKSKKEEYV